MPRPRCRGARTSSARPTSCKGQLDDAKAALGEAFEELKKVELLDERDQVRERADENAREQAELDRIGAFRFSTGGARAESSSSSCSRPNGALACLLRHRAHTWGHVHARDHSNPCRCRSHMECGCFRRRSGRHLMMCGAKPGRRFELSRDGDRRHALCRHRHRQPRVPRRLLPLGQRYRLGDVRRRRRQLERHLGLCPARARSGRRAGAGSNSRGRAAARAKAK